MSMHDIREAFVAAGGGALVLKHPGGATLHYTAVNSAGVAIPGDDIARTHQILRFQGTHMPSGKTFSADSRPLSAKDDLSQAAARVATDVLEKYQNP